MLLVWCLNLQPLQSFFFFFFCFVFCFFCFLTCNTNFWHVYITRYLTLDLQPFFLLLHPSPLWPVIVLVSVPSSSSLSFSTLDLQPFFLLLLPGPLEPRVIVLVRASFNSPSDFRLWIYPLFYSDATAFIILNSLYIYIYIIYIYNCLTQTIKIVNDSILLIVRPQYLSSGLYIIKWIGPQVNFGILDFIFHNLALHVFQIS